MAAGAVDDTRNMAALVTSGDQLATITLGNDVDSSSSTDTPLRGGDTVANHSTVRVLMKATVRRHTRVSYIYLDGCHDNENEGESASLGTATPELLLRSELSFVMSSSVIVPSLSHNYG